MIPRWKPPFDRQEIKYLLTSSADCIEKFEKEFARLSGSKYALSFHSGRSGLYALIKNMNVKKKEIIAPSFNCHVLPFVIQATENVPKFCRISLVDYNCIIDDMVSRCTKNTKIVIPTYMYGYPLDVKELKDRLDENIFIIEDSALGLLTRDAGRFGDAAFYSFGLFKPLYAFSGGMVTTDNAELYENLISFRRETLENCSKLYNIGEIACLLNYYPVYNFKFYMLFNIWQTYARSRYYEMFYNSYNHTIRCLFLSCSNIEAKIGLCQIKKARDIVAKRKKIAERYNKALQHLNEKIVLPPLIDGSSYAGYTIRVQERDNFEKNMLKYGVQINTLFRYSLPHMPQFQKYADDNFDNCLKASETVANLPNFPQLADAPEKLEHIVEAVEKSLQ